MKKFQSKEEEIFYLEEEIERLRVLIFKKKNDNNNNNIKEGEENHTNKKVHHEFDLPLSKETHAKLTSPTSSNSQQKEFFLTNVSFEEAEKEATTPTHNMSWWKKAIFYLRQKHDEGSIVGGDPSSIQIHYRWIYVCYLGLFLYYAICFYFILAFGFIQGNEVVEQWLPTCVMSIVLDLLLMQPILIFLRFVWLDDLANKFEKQHQLELKKQVEEEEEEEEEDDVFVDNNTTINEDGGIGNQKDSMRQKLISSSSSSLKRKQGQHALEEEQPPIVALISQKPRKNEPVYDEEDQETSHVLAIV